MQKQRIKWNNELIEKLSYACGKSPEYIKKMTKELIKKLNLKLVEG